MLQKLKVTSYALILCLFGLTLAAVSNVSAREGDSEEILECSEIRSTSRSEMKQKKDCFADVARALNAAIEELKKELEEAKTDKRQSRSNVSWCGIDVCVDAW